MQSSRPCSLPTRLDRRLSLAGLHTGGLAGLAFCLAVFLLAAGCSDDNTGDKDGGSPYDSQGRRDGGQDDGAQGDAGDLPPTRIYAAIVTHNEEAPHPICSSTVTEQAQYLANRSLTLDFAQMIIDHQAALNLQSDWQYLQAVQNWDSETVKAETDGLNLMAYLAQMDPQRIVVDAHAHETQYNYADVVHLLEELDVPRNGVVGGFLYYPHAEETWTRLRTPLQGSQFPQTTWQAAILWGAGTKEHAGPDSVASGIWRPKDAQHFHEDDPQQTLVNVGSGVPLDALLQRLHAGELEDHALYTSTFFINQCGLTEQTITETANLIDQYADAVAAGELVWAPLTEMVRVWRQEYQSKVVIISETPTDNPGDPDGGAGACVTDAGSGCPQGTVCCPAGLPCAGQCVIDCREPGAQCPRQGQTCNEETGLCEN